MPHIYVKPSPGGRVRMPERNFIPMSAAGAWVPRIDYYERLLIGGDVIECDPPAELPSVPEAYVQGISDNSSPVPEGWNEVAAANSAALASEPKPSPASPAPRSQKEK